LLKRLRVRLPTGRFDALRVAGTKAEQEAPTRVALELVIPGGDLRRRVGPHLDDAGRHDEPRCRGEQRVVASAADPHRPVPEVLELSGRGSSLAAAGRPLADGCPHPESRQLFAPRPGRVHELLLLG
jgi:hypothetical protein